jgi:endonuclease G
MVLSLLAAFFVLQSAPAWSDANYPAYTSRQPEPIKEHAYGDLPSKEQVLVRNAYIVRYNKEHRVPEWVAYHITEDYLKTPYRDQQFKRFHSDPDIDNPVRDEDYSGSGYDRGHLVPFKVSGGDRDRDGRYAMKDLNRDGKFDKNDKDPNGNYITDDPDDFETVKQVNYMSNIAPQHGTGFNRAGGLWWNLEEWVRKQLDRPDINELWIYAGCIFGQGKIEKVGPNKDITVPAAFYALVIQKPTVESEPPKVLAFLFPHQRERQGNLDDFLVSIDTIEALTGLDFFSTMDQAQQNELESTGTWHFWENF